jgi:poly(3-hydroxyalkanoate) depolymerase
MYLPARAIGRSTDPAKAAPSVLSTTAPTGAAMSSAAERIPREARPGVRTVVVSGTPLRVAIRPSTGTGPPLLLANGIGTSLEVFQPFVDALDPAIEVIRFDVPGVGGSPLPARPYRFATLARLLRGLLDELGYQAADILGFSWGGELAQQFALCSPRRCRPLVLVATGTGPQTMVPGNPLALAKMLTQRQYLDADYSRRIAGKLYGGSARTDPETISGILLQTRVGPLRGYLYQHAAGLGWTSLPFLPLIRQPTLVLAGDDDPIIPLVNARILAALIPSARLHVYSGGHAELVARPGLLAPLVSDFLARGSLRESSSVQR